MVAWRLIAAFSHKLNAVKAERIVIDGWWWLRRHVTRPVKADTKSEIPPREDMSDACHTRSAAREAARTSSRTAGASPPPRLHIRRRKLLAVKMAAGDAGGGWNGSKACAPGVRIPEDFGGGVLNNSSASSANENLP